MRFVVFSLGLALQQNWKVKPFVRDACDRTYDAPIGSKSARNRPKSPVGLPTFREHSAEAATIRTRPRLGRLGLVVACCSPREPIRYASRKRGLTPAADRLVQGRVETRWVRLTIALGCAAIVAACTGVENLIDRPWVYPVGIGRSGPALATLVFLIGATLGSRIMPMDDDGPHPTDVG